LRRSALGRVAGVTVASDINSPKSCGVAPELASEEMELFEAPASAQQSNFGVQDQVSQRETGIKIERARRSIQQQLGLALEEIAIRSRSRIGIVCG
jgi:hypothetical protein